MDPSPDARLGRVASRQAGAFNRTQAYSAGMSARMIAHRSARGEFEVLDVVHRSRHHRTAVHAGLRITQFEQVLVQLAGSRPDLVAAALHSGVDQSPQRLERVLRHVERLRHSRLPGLRGLAELAIDLEGDPPTQSELERRMLAVVASVPGMPAVTRQAPAPWAPTSASIVDGVVEAWRLILEADGRRFHERRAAFERDRWRDAEAAIAGYHVMRLTYRRLHHDEAGVRDQLSRYGERWRRNAA